MTLEPTFGNKSLSSSYHLPGNEPIDKNYLMSSIQRSPGFHPTSGNCSLSSSDCSCNFELASDKYLPLSSVYPLKHMASEQLPVMMSGCTILTELVRYTKRKFKVHILRKSEMM